ncbi:MAG TPA: glycosyltransferase family A protein [Fibrobacteria bacterium]|nr:glycosyltransferase family A protein [Fibrobacteria bacterium]
MSSRPTFSVVIPYYNEVAFLPQTLRTFLAQTRLPDQLILVDNGSTDGTEALCRAILEGCAIPDVRYMRESRPGKIFALEAAGPLVTGDFVAFADADIQYPPRYLETAEGLFRTAPPGTAAVMALYLHGDPETLPVSAYRWVMPLLSRIFPTKCLTGGGGQVFRTEAFRRAGGFSAATWNYVLLDHEIMHRIFKLGKSRYRSDFWCRHTNRRGSRRAVRWNAWERFLYLYMPPPFLDWYFYRFLGPRLGRRRMTQLSLRNQSWNRETGPR